MVVTTGVFDLFHPGHVEFLQQCQQFASDQWNELLVLVDTDERTLQIKGHYPIMPLDWRIQMVRAIVPRATIVPIDCHPVDLKDRYRFDYFIKGSDYDPKLLKGVYQCPIHIVPRTNSCSSTFLRERLTAQLQGGTLGA